MIIWVLSCSTVPRQTATETKKADVLNHPKVFQHVGLLVNQPPGMAGLPLV
jgi:hypothetical protein